jgi:hypothetical protein
MILILFVTLPLSDRWKQSPDLEEELQKSVSIASEKLPEEPGRIRSRREYTAETLPGNTALLSVASSADEDIERVAQVTKKTQQQASHMPVLLRTPKCNINPIILYCDKQNQST